MSRSGHTAPWIKPWQSGHASGGACLPQNALTSRYYSGVNILTLWDAALRKGYPIHRWLTFKQALDARAHVRKGEKGTRVVFTKQLEVEGETGEGEATRRRIPLLPTFNVAQVEGLPGIM